MEETPIGDSTILEQIISMKMPFGKYKGYMLRYLPVNYLEWFAQKGFPKNKLGNCLETLYEIKLNGLEYLLDILQDGK